MSDEAVGVLEAPETIEEWMRRSCCRFCGSRRYRVHGLVRAMQDYDPAGEGWGDSYNIDCCMDDIERVRCQVCDKELWTEGNQVPEVVTERDTYHLWVRALPAPGGEPGAGPWVKVSDGLALAGSARLVTAAQALWEADAAGVKVTGLAGELLFFLDRSPEPRP